MFFTLLIPDLENVCIGFLLLSLLSVALNLTICRVIEENYEKSIRNIGRIGKYGMKSTDVEILNIMLGH